MYAIKVSSYERDKNQQMMKRDKQNTRKSFTSTINLSEEDIITDPSYNTHRQQAFLPNP